MKDRTYPQGVPCWIHTEQPDVDAAVQFYGGVFAWTFEDAMPSSADGRYVVAKLNGQDIGAIAGPGSGPATWTTYIAVDDADEMVRRLVASGATLLSGPADAGNGGRGAMVADPKGIEFGIWQARRRLGAQAVNEPGAWNFSDLHTADPAPAISFYGQAFGWVFDNVGFATMIRQPGYGNHLESTIDPDIKARQAAVSAPPGFADAIAWLAPISGRGHPNWHVTFTVEDRDQTVAGAERLGAEVLEQDDNEWTRSARIRDPQGAEFTVSQFAPASGSD